MATVNLGRIKPVFRGAYSGGTAYVIDDIVTSGNETYICIQAHGAGTQAVSQTAYWTKLAAKGTDGTDGTDVGTTITTQGDILYRDGSGLQRLAAGTSGQFLKTQGSGANPVWADSGGAIKKVTMFCDSSHNISTSSTSSSFPLSWTFAKAEANTDIYIHGWTPVSGQNSWIAGMRMKIQRASDSSYDIAASPAAADDQTYGGNNFLSPQNGHGDDDSRGTILWGRHINTSTETFFNTAQNYTIHLGWESRSCSNERPANVWNPTERSSRDRRQLTMMYVYEIDASTTAYVT